MMTTMAHARPSNDTAVALQHLADEHALYSAGFFEPSGERLVTWISPYGNQAQIDYILVPDSMSEQIRVLGKPWLEDAVGDIDHRPFIVQMEWGAPAAAQFQVPRWDRAKLRSPESRDALQHIFATVLQIPWTYHVDDHIQLINDHLHSGLVRHFVADPCRPRQPHVSDAQWAAIRERRHARRLVVRSRRLRQRVLLNAVLQAWRAECGVKMSANTTAASQRLHRARLSEARLGRVIRSLGQTIKTLSHSDVAAHTRNVLRTAQGQGPAALYSALRGVMKVGRRYKAPQALPALASAGNILCDPDEIRAALTQHFAQPEHGHETAVSSLVHCEPVQDNCVIDALALPTLADVIQGWLSLKDGKAAGISGIPAEVYRYAPLAAAECHAPLLVKMAIRRHWPVIWRGTLNAAIPKPNKDGSKLASWRSIALAEAAYKGVGRALRRRLAKGLQVLSSPGQNGSLPGEQIGAPAHHVLAHLQLALHRGVSTAIIFLDGRSAYYATLREFLFDQRESDPESLRRLIAFLIPDETLHDVAIACLLGPGLLQAGGLSPSLEGYLRQGLQATWFTLDAQSPHVQQTHSGTNPGSPLADMLYQFVQTRFMDGVMQELRDHDLQVRVHATSDPVHPQGWADDVAVILPLGLASQVVQQLQVCIPIVDRHSRCLGVELNFDSGKTEALVCLRGKGSKEVRRDLLGADHPTVPVLIPNRPTVHLRLVDEYLHLGNTVTHSASCIPDVRCKMAAADQIFQRLKRTLLRNPELSAMEKTQLVESLILSKIRFGAGLWCPRSQSETANVQTAMTKFWRQSCRAITGHSVTFLDESEVCALLGIPTAEQCRVVDVVRQLAVVAETGPGYLWDCLLTTNAWLRQAVVALQTIHSVLNVPLPAFESALPCLRFLQHQRRYLSSLLRRFRKVCSLNSATCQEAVQAKASKMLCFEKAGGVLVPAPTAPIGSWKCDRCLLRFSCKASMSSHRSTVHGI